MLLHVAAWHGSVLFSSSSRTQGGRRQLSTAAAIAIVSLGGGSSHDCAKGVGMVVGNGGNIRDYEGLNKTSKPMPPFLAVNTTAGTASGMTRFCIIANTDTHVKMALIDWRCTPNVAINDPLLMVACRRR